jgi:surface carbohydrate biosynthesis protein (TIGR04326 family)
MILRAGLAWARSLIHSLRTPVHDTIDADVVFVEYWPTASVVDAAHPESWTSPYFGSLPERLRQDGISVGFVHVHSDGPVTRPPRGVRRRIASLRNSSTTHRLLADEHSPTVWWSALRVWLRLIRLAPSTSDIARQLSAHGDASRLWRWWAGKYVSSVFGSHAVRTCLLGEFFGRLVARNQRTRLWIMAFEGQSWESCLARQLDAAGATWLPYLHTMMRPWDLRAHTFLAEHAPSRLAVHGTHDRDELSTSGIQLVEVEALRYQHLGQQVPRLHSNSGSHRQSEKSWLIVGGADCDGSSRELQAFLAAIESCGTARKVVVKWHPQCIEPSADPRFVITTQPLRTAFADADAVLMVGSAAPLDAYLAGIPSCSFVAASGLSTTPLSDDDYFHLSIDANDAVTWMAMAESRRNHQPPVDRYFVIDGNLPRWCRIVTSAVVG